MKICDWSKTLTGLCGAIDFFLVLLYTKYIFKSFESSLGALINGLELQEDVLYGRNDSKNVLSA